MNLFEAIACGNPPPWIAEVTYEREGGQIVHVHDSTCELSRIVTGLATAPPVVMGRTPSYVGPSYDTYLPIVGAVLWIEPVGGEPKIYGRVQHVLINGDTVDVSLILG